jgi:hypothetical protein
MPRPAARWLAIPLFVSAAGGGTVAACSLDLDPSLMESGPVHRGDAATSPRDAPAPSEDVALEAEASAHGNGITCADDSDCAVAAQAGACVTSSTCDPTWHVCMLDVCDAGACAVASCDLLAKQCEAPMPMGFTISLFPVVEGGVGGYNIQWTLAAAYPFLFVLTTNGVVAYNVANPTTNIPPAVTIHGIPFIPAALVSTGRRVYAVSGVQGSGPTYRQSVAWLDVPGDPFLTSLQATAAWIGTTQPTLASPVVVASGRLDLVYFSSFDPIASLAPPIADSMVVVPAPVASLNPNAGIVSSTGDDLVAYRYNYSSAVTTLARVSGVDTGGGQATAERAFGPDAGLHAEGAFAVGQDGSILWENAPLRATNDGIATARLTWLSPTSDARLFDDSVYADLETYPALTAGPVVGPPAWLDANTAVGFAASPDDMQSTSVQVVDRPARALFTGKRALLPTASTSLAVATSGGFVYVLAKDDPQNQSATVYILAPGCAGGTVAPMDAGEPADAEPVDAQTKDAGRPVDAGKPNDAGRLPRDAGVILGFKVLARQ